MRETAVCAAKHFPYINHFRIGDLASSWRLCRHRGDRTALAFSQQGTHPDIGCLRTIIIKTPSRAMNATVSMEERPVPKRTPPYQRATDLLTTPATATVGSWNIPTNISEDGRQPGAEQNPSADNPNVYPDGQDAARNPFFNPNLHRRRHRQRLRVQSAVRVVVMCRIQSAKAHMGSAVNSSDSTAAPGYWVDNGGCSAMFWDIIARASPSPAGRRKVRHVYGPSSPSLKIANEARSASESAPFLRTEIRGTGTYSAL